MNYFIDQENFPLIEGGVVLSDEQLLLIGEPTPDSEITIKTDGEFTHKSVTAAYVKMRLNLIFGFNWDFQIVGYERLEKVKQALVHGRLTIRTKKGTIIKEQFGKGSGMMDGKSYDTANMLKAAASDCLKKCASEIGICWDIYSQEPQAIEIEEPVIIDEQQQAKLDRLTTFLDKASNIKDVHRIIAQWKKQATVTEVENKLFTQYLNKFKK